MGLLLHQERYLLITRRERKRLELMKKIVILLVVIVVTTTALPVYGGEVPKLSKEEATKILESMGYTDVVVGFVIHGISVSEKGYAGTHRGDSVALVGALVLLQLDTPNI